MSTEPKVGDIVDVTIKGARVHHQFVGGDHSYLSVVMPGPNCSEPCEQYLRLDSPAVTVVVTEPVVPAAWPPHLNDLWRDRDQNLWFAVHVDDVDSVDSAGRPGGPIIALVQAGNGSCSSRPVEVNRECGPLQLVRREAGQPEGSWPPRPGDVWRDRGGDEWVTVAAPGGGVAMRDSLGNEMAPEVLSRGWGPLTFVRRDQPEAGR
jgi:hypothetical protein